jgi:hypothetical protein
MLPIEPLLKLTAKSSSQTRTQTTIASAIIPKAMGSAICALCKVHKSQTNSSHHDHQIHHLHCTKLQNPSHIPFSAQSFTCNSHQLPDLNTQNQINSQKPRQDRRRSLYTQSGICSGCCRRSITYASSAPKP